MIMMEKTSEAHESKKMIAQVKKTTRSRRSHVVTVT